MKSPLLLVLLSSTLFAYTHAWVGKNVGDRVKGRVIHFESLLKRGRWLMQNDVKDKDGSRYLYVDKVPKSEIYFEPKVQFKVHDCGHFLCFESLSLPSYYLAAGWPAEKKNEIVVKLAHSTHPESGDDEKFLWKIYCEDETLDKCRVFCSRIFHKSVDFLLITEDNKAGPLKGTDHFRADMYTLSSESVHIPAEYWKIHAENPSDAYEEIFSSENAGSTAQKASYKATVGVSTTDSRTHTFSVGTSIEIGAAFKIFSATASASIDKSWETASSKTFERTKEISHDLVLPPRTKIVLKQLVGRYAGIFRIGADKYKIEETKVTKRSYIFHPRAWPLLSAE